MSTITDGAVGCRKLCNNRKFLQWSLAYMWTEKSQVIDDITRLELPVTHYLREMYTMNAYSASEGTKIDSNKFAIGNIYEKLKVYFFYFHQSEFNPCPLNIKVKSKFTHVLKKKIPR
jgi:hypothetical protein